MPTIMLSQGQYAYVDADDYEWLNGDTWSYQNGYAARYSNGCLVYMHNAIAERHTLACAGCVDHIDRNRANNHKSNFRAATRQQQNANRATPVNNRSGYRGVCWVKARCRWLARIGDNGVQRFLGEFKDKQDAARAYDRAALDLHGEFAILNLQGSIL